MKERFPHLWQFLWIIVLVILLFPVISPLAYCAPKSWDLNWIDWILDQASANRYTDDPGPL